MQEEAKAAVQACSTGQWKVVLGLLRICGERDAERKDKGFGLGHTAFQEVMGHPSRHIRQEIEAMGWGGRGDFWSGETELGVFSIGVI